MNNVILAALKLSRAMRRCPPPPDVHPFPPAVGRLLACVSRNRGVSSRDLCELLDLRPSSLSEMLARAENEGWIVRTVDEEDRRILRVDLSPKGEAFLSGAEEAREKDLARKTACFTEEEKEQFCALCEKLCSHLESLDFPDRRPFGRPGPDGPKHPPRPGFPHEPDFPQEPGFPEPPEQDGASKSPEAPEAPQPRMIPPEKRIRC